MKNLFYFVLSVLFLTACLNNTKTTKEETEEIETQIEEIDERSSTSWCDCAITYYETKNIRTQKEEDFLKRCNNYANSLPEKDRNSWEEKGFNSGCLEDYMWSYLDEENSNLGSSETPFPL